jgi:signal transduction histidine kinase
VFKRIRTKLAVVLAIPLLILVSVAYLEVFSSLRQSRSVGTQSDLATVAIGPGGLVSGLQTERNQAGLQVLGFDSKVALGVSGATEARAIVDRSATAFRASIRARGATTTEAYQGAFDALGRLHGLRAQLDAFHGAAGAKASPATTLLATNLFDGYTTIIQAFFDANSRISVTVDNAQLRTGIELLDVTLRQQESESLAIRDAFLSTFAGGLTASGQLPAYVTDVADFHNWTQRMSVLATGAYAAPVKAYIDGTGFTTLNKTLDSYLKGAPIDLPALLAASNPAGATGATATLIPGAVLQTQLGALVGHQADHLRSAARTRLLLFILLAVAAAGMAVGLVVLATRSITRPLRRLAEQADTMASTTLPTAVQSILDTPLGEDVTVPKVTPITVPTRDEVGDVATALNTVQDSALELAVEQAVLRRNIADSFVNLGRRNQNLLGRQLDFITALENKETEPGKLDDLFRLDHLATRMRRNAESLLVLAGLESPRQWSAPVAVGDIMRASLAEVEDYRRVSVRQVDPAAVPGSAAADLAHIIAELVENALAASPPDTQVEVYGRSNARDYLISVVDRGVGMSLADLERANVRLAGGESFTVAPSRYLGHYVAGHLAARYGVKVLLQDSDSGGIKARILLPAALLDQLSPSKAPPVTPPPASVAPPAETGPPPTRPTTAPLLATPAPRPTAPAAPAPIVSGNGNGPGPVVVPGGGGYRTAVPPAPAPVPVPVPAPAPALATRVPVAETPAPAPFDTALGPIEAGIPTTAGGLVRRVPGASISDEPDDQSLLRTVDDDDNEESGDTSAHEVYRMLSNLWTDNSAKSPAPRQTEHPERGRND